jgi:hypothetical protein
MKNLLLGLIFLTVSTVSFACDFSVNLESKEMIDQDYFTVKNTVINKDFKSMYKSVRDKCLDKNFNDCGPEVPRLYGTYCSAPKFNLIYTCKILGKKYEVTKKTSEEVKTERCEKINRCLGKSYGADLDKFLKISEINKC